MSQLKDILAKLPTQTKVTYEGRALSRDKDHLHVAVSSGVIAIPLADIESATQVPGQPNDIVTVVVKNPFNVKTIRRAGRIGPGFGGGFGGTLGGFSSDTYSNGRYIDSATASGGQADATDDTIWLEERDDIWT